MIDDVLGLVFTFHVSLKEWVESGLFEREKQIYEEHLRLGNFGQIIWFSYGNEDERLAQELVSKGRLDSRIVVVGLPRWVRGRVSRLLYSFIIPYVRNKEIGMLDIIKSNQMEGARVAAAISKKSGAVFELRTGYTYTVFAKKSLYEGEKRLRNLLRYIYYSYMEKKLYNVCDYAFVSSKQDRDYVCNRYSVNGFKIQLLTNYINISQFKPMRELEERDIRFLMVGRLNEQKNVINTLRAFSRLKVGIDIYGDGSLKEDIEQVINKLGIDAVLKGKIPNADLPVVYNKYRFFILTSVYEGMPKSLLEAMACGCICLGTDVEGINEIIVDNYNGFVIPGTSEEEIFCRIKEVYDNQDMILLKNISERAVQYVQNNHSLSDIARREYLAFEKEQKNREFNSKV